MAVKPILFNTDMVRAILDERKTVTRRIVKPKYRKEEFGWRIVTNKSTDSRFVEYTDEDEVGIGRLIIPPCQIGDILYVRETWQDDRIYTHDDTHGRYFYKADGDVECHKWHPSIHMPKEAARIWLKVTDVRVERLQDITITDSIKEGITNDMAYEANDWIPTFYDSDSGGGPDYISAFSYVWNATIPKKDLPLYGWQANPWVWVIEFERCEKPEE